MEFYPGKVSWELYDLLKAISQIAGFNSVPHKWKAKRYHRTQGTEDIPMRRRVTLIRWKNRPFVLAIFETAARRLDSSILTFEPHYKTAQLIRTGLQGTI